MRYALVFILFFAVAVIPAVAETTSRDDSLSLLPKQLSGHAGFEFLYLTIIGLIILLVPLITYLLRFNENYISH